MKVVHSEPKVIFEGKDIALLKNLFDSVQQDYKSKEFTIQSDSWMTSIQRKEYHEFIVKTKSTLELYFG